MHARYPSALPATTLSMEFGPLPLDRPVAAHDRPSSESQIGNVSTQMQTVDRIDDLQALGWSNSQILLIDLDAGISGTTTIQERQGMSLLFRLISEGKLGAVACLDEDRLFRDITQIQVNLFLEACRASRVLVLTSRMICNFASERLGAFHARQFRFKSEMAAGQPSIEQE